MKVPLGWLKEYVPIRLSPKALAARLTMAGLEVGSVHDVDGEAVFDIEVTPNRADCLSIIGMAREVAAVTGQRLKLPMAQIGASRTRKGADQSVAGQPTTMQVSLEDKLGCPRYIGRLLNGVKVAPSPEWMQRRLIACGARPINNLVDVTNYVLFEYGQPLHVFDLARLAGGVLVVRRARPHESLTMLDGVKRTLAAGMLVIADAERPVAVAGVMGGAESAVSASTTAVVLESALFDPITVRRTARALGLASESSYRFERGVDPLGVEAASARAAALVARLADGVQRQVCDTGAKPPARATIVLDLPRANRWLGTAVSSSQARTMLARLSCRVASSGTGDTLRVSPPSFRRDLLKPEDLYEELARLGGYDALRASVPSALLSAGRAESSYHDARRLKSFCVGLGLTETINWSLVSGAELARFGCSEAEAVRLANPLSQDRAFLRPALLMGLLQAVRQNLTQGASGVRLFEMGHVMRPAVNGAGTGFEHVQLGLALAGVWSHDWRSNQPSHFFRLKGLVEALVDRACRGVLTMAPASLPWMEPGHGVAFSLDGRPLGVAGQLKAAITTAVDLEQPVWCAEVSVEVLRAAKRKVSSVEAPTATPAVKRDLSIVLEDAVRFHDVDRLIRDAGGPLASSVELIDRYTGKQVPPGKHSLTFSIAYRDSSRTLTAEEADALHGRILQALEQRFGAQRR